MPQYLIRLRKDGPYSKRQLADGTILKEGTEIQIDKKLWEALRERDAKKEKPEFVLRRKGGDTKKSS